MSSTRHVTLLSILLATLSPILLPVAATAACLAADAPVASRAGTHEFSQLSMGTKVRIVLVADDEVVAADHAAAAFAQLDALEQEMSDWRDDSALSDVDRAAGGAAIVVPNALHRALRLARRMAEVTDGAFDPTVGPLVRLWRAAREAGAPPDDAAIDAAVDLVDWRELQVLPDSRVRLPRAGMRLDLGGIGKGFALDEIATLLRERGLGAFLLDFGSVALAVGAPPNAAHWRVALEHAAAIPLRDAAVAFTGDAEQAMTVDGVRLGHVIDPTSGAALPGPMIVMVVAPEAAVADALSTAAAVLGPDAALRMASRLDRVGVAIDAQTPSGRRAVETPGLAALAGGEAAPPEALRRVRRGDVLQLEVPEIVFECVDGMRPPITLLGVAHIGDRDAYARLQRILDGHSGGLASGERADAAGGAGGAGGVVLFESVLPDGARRPGGDDALTRVSSTRATMHLLAEEFGALEAGAIALRAEAAPTDAITQAIEAAVKRRPRNGPLLRPLTTDAWGHSFRIESRPDNGGELLDVVSLGADGAAGGEGEAADLVVAVRPREGGDDGGLQADLARALGLAFQLQAMNYDRLNWRAADMTIAELTESARAHGADPGPLLGSLAGGSLPASAIRMMLRLVGLADGLAGGMIRDTMKALMIELLAEPDVLELADAQMGALMRVILDERNVVAVEALVEAIGEAPVPRSVALFYGAAHVPDLAERVEALGYRAVSVEWHPMIALNLAESRVDERQLAQLRRMIGSMARPR